MNRFARIGEIADPCGVPLPRSTRVPSGCCSGAASHRFTYSSTQRQSVTASTALTMRSHGTSSKNFWTSKIDRPVVLPAPLPAYRKRVMSRAFRPIAIGVLVKPRFHQRLQEHGHHRLRDPVCDRRHAEHPDPTAMRLGDLDRPDRRREPGPRAHPIPDLVEVVLKVGLELVQILPIHSGGALVGLDLPPRLPHHQLGNRKRLVLAALACSSSLPPRTHAPVDRHRHSW